MNGNSFGTNFRVTTWGESHGPALGAVIDGCPSGLALGPEDFVGEMQRRQGAATSFTTPRREEDRVEIESGVFAGLTTGAPISLRIENRAQKSSDYEELRGTFRPGHADLTTYLKHGHRDHRGGGRSSARETVARVAAGVVAKKLLSLKGVEIAAWVERVGPMELPEEAREGALSLPLRDLRQLRDSNPLAIPCRESEEMLNAVERLRSAGDSWGGGLRCRIEGLPAGLGEPVFDKLNALLAHGLMSLPAAVSCEVGGGDALSRLPGSAIRDPIEKGPRPASNRHGGILGGMSTGLPLILAVSIHAPTSISRPILTVNENSETKEITVGGRHDSFPLPRAVPMVEAMAALVLADAFLRAGRIPEKLAPAGPAAEG
jgi:chorismate synthase